MGALKKNIPNIITCIRLVGAVVIFFLPALSLEFYIVYGLCGFTDVLDGFIARHYHLESKLGSVLDSIADLLFLGVMAYKIWPTLMRLLHLWNWFVLGIPTFFHICSYTLCAIKFHKFSSLHTFSNKILSFSIFFYPFTFIGEIRILFELYTIIFGVNALYGSIEMNLIHLITPVYNEDNKSVFKALAFRKEYYKKA